MKNSCTLSAVFLSLFVSTIFLFSSSNATTKLVQDVCKKISQDDPDVTYGFCLRAFGSDLRSSRAINMEKLGLISMQLGITKASKMSSMVDVLVNNPKSNLNAGRTLQMILELYLEAQLDLEAGLKALHFKDYMEANNRASSATISGVTCRDAIKAKKRLAFVLLKEAEDFFLLASISNAITNMLQDASTSSMRF